MTIENSIYKPYKHLYIIGNGFDLHHGAESSYFHFREYITRYDPDFVLSFEMFFGEGALFSNRSSEALWSDFEQNLSELDREKIFDYVDMKLPMDDEGDDKFLYAEYFAPIDEVSCIVEQCTTSMQYRFHKWINTLHYKHGFKQKMVELERDAIFLNFNYTLQLENEYSVPRDHILYIHGNRRDSIGSLVLGHNVEDRDKALEKWIHKHKNRRRYRPNLKDKKGRYFANDKLVYLAYFLENEDKGNYRKTIRYYAIDHIQEYLEQYYNKNIKYCDDIIAKNADFFNSLSTVEEITVLGHSLGEVDMAYFEKITQIVSSRTKWSFSYYNDKDIMRINKFCRHLKIPKPTGTQLFRMEDIIPC